MVVLYEIFGSSSPLLLLCAPTPCAPQFSLLIDNCSCTLVESQELSYTDKYMTDAKKSPISTAEHLKRIASRVNPKKLFTKEKNNEQSNEKHNAENPEKAIRRLSVEFDKSAIAGHEGHATHTGHPHGSRGRSKSTSSLYGPKLEYNPYGIYSHHNIQRLGSAFGNGTEKNECVLMLSNPTSLPNEYLPSLFKEDVQCLEEKYELFDENVTMGGSAAIRKICLKEDSLRKSRLYALKKFSIYVGESQEKYYSRVATEYTITRSVAHLHTIPCYELLQLPVILQRAWGMVMDYYEYDLYKLIRNPDWKKVAFAEKMCIFKQICFGVKYIHEQDIAHLDVKPENIMVARNGLMKITDYGCSEIGHEVHGNFTSKIAYKTTRLGTPPYQAPEVSRYGLFDQDSRQPYCPFRFDYWSLGVLLFVVVMGKNPFLAARDSDLGYQLFKKEYLKYIEANSSFSQDKSDKIPKNGIFSDPHGNDPRFIYLFWRLCDPNPSTRMTLPKLFHNKFFQKSEMCVDERIYECNFSNHTKAKHMQFKVPFGSTEEYTQQKEIKHSSWDDIPTVDTVPQVYHSLVNKEEGGKKNDLAYTYGESRHDLPRVDECDEEPENDGVIHGEHSFSSAQSSFCSLRRARKESTPAKSVNDTQHSFQSLRTNPSYRSYSRKLNNNPLSFVYPDGTTKRTLFANDDYDNSETEYMIVKFADICEACNCRIVPHAHNMLYSYKEKLSAD